MKTKIVLFAGLISIAAATGFAKSHIAKALPCPSQDFKVFLNSFAAKTEVQKAFTAIPGVSADQLNFPMIPNEKMRKKEGMNLKIDKLNKKSADVVLDKDETDFKIVFHFEKKACWMLVKAEDVSG